MAKDHRLLTDYHFHVQSLKRDAIQQRIALGQEYLRRHADRDPGEIVTRDRAFASLDLSHLPVMQATIAEARSMIEVRKGTPVWSKESLDYLTPGTDYTDDSAAVALATSPELLCPIIRYFGMLPILFSLFVTRANAKELLRDSSHMFHTDPDDITQIKAFVHLSDIDAECGPFQALPAQLSEEVNRALGFPRGRVTDEEVEALVGRNRTLTSIGPAGTVSICDTTRCFHFGGRPPKPGKPIRDLLFIRYLLPTCTVYPQFEGDGVPPSEVNLHRRADDPMWNALIGADLT
jgi:hypothetical protein